MTRPRRLILLALAIAWATVAAALGQPAHSGVAQAAEPLHAAQPSASRAPFRVAVRASRRSTRPRRAIRVRGKVRPRAPHRHVLLQERLRGRWRVAARVRLSRRSTFSIPYSARRPGGHLLRVVKPRSRGRAAGTSRGVRIVAMARRTARSEGGPLRVGLGAVRVIAPKGAIRKGKTLTIRTAGPRGPRGFPSTGGASLAGGPYVVSTSQGKPSKPVTVRLRYDRGRVSREGAPLILHGMRELGAWVPERTRAKGRFVSARLRSFSPLDVVDGATWLSGRITGNRTDLPANCGEVPSWINGAFFPFDRNDALPACVSNRTDGGTLRINVVNNRGYAQLVRVSGARLAVDRSGPWSASLDGVVSKGLAELSPANGPSSFMLAPGASATIALERPLSLLGQRAVSIRAAPRGGSAVAQLAWALLSEIEAVKRKVAVPVGVTNCAIGVLYNSTSSASSASSAIDGLRSCVAAGAGLTGVAKVALRKIATAVLVTDVFHKVVDLAGDEAFPARIEFSFQGVSRTDSDIALGNLDVGTVPAGERTTWKLSSSGGVTPHSFAISTISKNIGRVPDWASLAPDGTLAIDPPSGTDAFFSFYVFLTDATGRRSATGLYLVTFTVESNEPPEPEPPVALADAWAGYLYQTALYTVLGTSVSNVAATGLPSWLRIGENGALAGVPPGPGTVTFDATWTRGAGAEPASGSFEISVTEPPELPAPALPHLGVVGNEHGTARLLRESPTGRYVAALLGTPETVVLYDLVTEELETLTWGIDRSGIGHGGSPDNLAWSPDGRYLAFTSTEPLLGMPANGRWYNVYLYDVEQGELTRLTDGTPVEPLPGTDRADSYTPVWSPDGTLLAFAHAGGVALHDPVGGDTELLDCRCRMVVSAESFSTEPWTEDSQHLTLVTVEHNFYDVTGAVVWDRSDDTLRTLFEGPHDVWLSADGYRALASHGIVEGQLVLDVVTGDVLAELPDARLRTGAGTSGLTRSSHWSPDGSLIAAGRCPPVGSCVDGALDVATGQFVEVADPAPIFGGWKGDDPLWCDTQLSGARSCHGIDADTNAPYEFPLPSCGTTYCAILAVSEDGYYDHYTDDDVTVVRRASW